MRHNNRMDTHVHIPLHSQLSEYVTSIWEVNGHSYIRETILPKGIVEMVFNLGDPISGLMPGQQSFTAPLCFIQGVNTQNVEVVYDGHHHLFGVRLQPGMVRALLGVFPSELKNTLIDLTLIRPGFNMLWHQLKESVSFEDRVRIIEDQFPVLSAVECLRTQQLCRLFMQEGLAHFNDPLSLSEQVHYSTRQLNRKTQSLFGLSAEELILYKKFLHAVKLLHHDTRPLTAIALESGFYDQAHFCRVFKSYSGITAGQYRKNMSMLPFHLFSHG